jgi:putative peptidoglycan lipid II flippase
VQISAYVDAFIASLLPTGAVAAISYAQTLYLLPVSLFGMSVSASELPVMSGATGDTEQVAAWLRNRLTAGLRRIAFFIVPSTVGFLALGDQVVGAIYQTGQFGRDDTLYVWAILAGATVGLLAGTLGRLYASTFYALKDTRTPLVCAIARVCLGTALGFGLSLYAPDVLGLQARWGACGITVGSGVAAWCEFTLLRHFLNRRIGPTGLPARLVASLYASAVAGAAAGWGLKLALPDLGPIPEAVLVLGLYGGVYFGAARLLGVPEVTMVTGRIERRLRRR